MLRIRDMAGTLAVLLFAAVSLLAAVAIIGVAAVFAVIFVLIGRCLIPVLVWWHIVQVFRNRTRRHYGPT